MNTRLISGRDGAQLWSKRYDRDLIDVFVIQDEISNAIANELKVSLTTQKLVKAPTTQFAAYEAVLQGRYHFYRFDPSDQAKALEHFERAIAIDPQYAAAHIGIALNYCRVKWWSAWLTRAKPCSAPWKPLAKRCGWIRPAPKAIIFLAATMQCTISIG